MNPVAVESNDVMAIVHYFKVNSSYSSGSRLKVQDLHHNYPFEINGKELVESAFSADRFDEVKNTTKTKIAEQLVQAGHKPFTVHFVKQDGTPRTLRGRLLGTEHMMGRSKVEDLDEPNHSKRFKQVDHRTIQWLILDDIKYRVK